MEVLALADIFDKNSFYNFNLKLPLNYKHYISLGFCCAVATDMKSLGLRECSSPLDWNCSNWMEGVEIVLQNHFEDYLNYDLLYQQKDMHHIYKNMRYSIGFFHDFKANYSLKSQLKPVQEKYDRRIERFYKNIAERTLFFRYIKNARELRYMNENWQKAVDIVKGFCPENDIIFVCHCEEIGETEIKIPNLFYIEKSPSDYSVAHPLYANSNLLKMLEEAVITDKEKNIEFAEESKNKKLSKNDKINHRIRRGLERHVFKDYTHENQCD